MKQDETIEVECVENQKLPLLTQPDIQTGPEDISNKVYYCFLYLGFCTLVPWSCVLNTFDFMVLMVSLTMLSSDGQLSADIYLSFRQHFDSGDISNLDNDNRRHVHV